MSEPIQSIAQNNYILHNIDAKKLYVQEPLFTANSGDAVYVGWRPDETVLADNISNAATAFTLSEKPSNFERLRIYSTKGPICETSASDTYLTWAASWIDSSTNNMLNRVYQARSNNGTSWSGGRVYGYHMNDNNTITGDYGSSGWYLETYKIVGINRKENA